MITAKGLKQGSPSQQSQPTHEDYAEKEQGKRSIVPLAFLLFLTGCATYLKSFLPVRLEAREAEHAAKQDESDQSEPRSEGEVSVAPGEAAAEEDAAPGNGRTRHSSDNVIPISLFRESGDGVIVAPGSIQPAAPRPVKLAAPNEDAFRGNDIRPPTASSSGDGGGGSGGGGGGGGGGSGGVDRQPISPSASPTGSSRSADPTVSPRNSDPPGDTPSDLVRNRAPRTNGPVRLQDLAGCQVFMISMAALLAGATDPDGDHLSIAGLSSTSGTLVRTEDGGWIFERDRGMLGEVTLTYTINDGSASVVQTAYFNVVEAPPIIGTAADDILLGTNCGETIDGRAGDDNIDARGGNDTIIGGAGDDHIIAGPGNDVVYAGAGNDVVFAGLGNDIVFGGSGNDHLYGEDGDDTILGEEGDDFISGGSGVDILLAGDGNDTVQGGAGNDTLDGGDGNDNLDGGFGNDVIIGAAGNDHLLGDDGNDVLSDGAGQDTVYGGAGDDHVVAATDAANDTYDGGTGRDTLDYSATTQGVVADLRTGTADGDETGHDVIANFEEVVGGSGDDQIVAGSAPVSMAGGAGNDALEGGSGDDTISDGTGRDTVLAGGGDDHVMAATDAANDSYDGGDGQDRLDYSTASSSITVDLAMGTAEGTDVGRDMIAAFEEIVTGSGDDHLVAGSTSISMTGGAGNDTFEFQRADEDEPAMTVRKITDFTVGDRIVAATYEISYFNEDDVEDALSDLFEDIYLAEGDKRPVRFRFEDQDNDQRTMIEVHDRPDADEFFTIEVVGHHQLQFTIVGT